MMVIYKDNVAIYAATDPSKFTHELSKHATEPDVSWGNSTSKKEPVGHARQKASV